jgi:hypothetical protein
LPKFGPWRQCGGIALVASLDELMGINAGGSRLAHGVRRSGATRDAKGGPGMAGFRPVYDAQASELKDRIKAGIIDPTKVVRTALHDASSVSGLLITTEAMVASNPEKEAMPAGGGMEF